MVHTRCAFCQELERIYARKLTLPQKNAAIDELWNRADRAARLHRVYGQRKGHR